MKRVLAWSGAAVAALLLIALYGVFVEPRLVLDERRYEVALPGVEGSWDGAEVAVFSDLQVGMWLANTGMIRRVVDRVVDADPDVVLLAGDFVYSEDPPVAVTVDAVMQLLAPLAESGIPTYAVLGNHDYRAEAADELTSAPERAGIGLLQTKRSRSLLRVGMVRPCTWWASARTGRADPAGRGARRGAGRRPADRVHAQPGVVPDAAAEQCAAGCRRAHPLRPDQDPRSSAVVLPAAAGRGARHCRWVRAEGYGATGNDLFVTCGIGFSLIPMRVNAPPQVVFFELAAPV